MSTPLIAWVRRHQLMSFCVLAYAINFAFMFIYKALPAFTAQDVAASAHIPGKDLAKTVIIKADGKVTMAVLPASFRIDLQLLQAALQTKSVVLAEESDFAELFPDCEVGAMPPFGNLYGIETIVAQDLAEDEVIAFNAGSHRELVEMSFADFESLVKPRLISFTIARNK